MLASLAGDVPVPILVAAYNRWASEHKFGKRTRWAILSRARLLNADLEVCGSWIAYPILIDALGPRVAKWVDSKQLESHKMGRLRFIKRCELRSFAENHPRLFSGLSVSDLVMILDSVPLAEKLAAQAPYPKPGVPRQVVCKETGKKYPSLTSAAKAHYVHKNTVLNSIRTGRPCICGRTFAYAC